LIAELGREIIKGYEGDSNDIGHPEHVASCSKHFLGYQVPFSGKDRTNANIPMDALYEYHLPPYRVAVDAGTHTFMINSGLVNNYPVHANPDLLTQLLKKDLKFNGLIVTDWADIENLFTRDHIAKDHKDAIRLGINAGIDMSMVPYNYEQFCKLLVELVNEGAVPISRIDDATSRILRIKVKLGLMEKPTTNPKDYPKFGSKEFEEASYQGAAEAITLLKNEGNILPRSKTAKVLVTGPNANSMRTLNGAWTYSWQGDKVEQFAGKYNTILEAVQLVGGAANVSYAPAIKYKAGGKYYEEENDNMDAALAAAKNVDVVVLCLGENTYVEKPGDLNDLYLSDMQTEFAQKMIATGKPIVLVLNEGRPRIISKIEPGIKGIVQTYLPGNLGGNAIADVLYGDINPSGKLPYTYPRYPNTLITYIHKYSEEQKKGEGVYNYEADYNPQYEFGHGLSYTTFTHEKLAANKSTYGKKDVITLTVEVTNTGKRAGKITTELYSSDLQASRIAPDVRRLRRFEKISLAPSARQTLTFTIPVAELAHAGPDGKPVLEDGEFTFAVGGQKVTVLVKD
jgi:beta-glucosidase